MHIPTESIGSLPREPMLQDAYAQHKAGNLPRAELDQLAHAATIAAIHQLESIGNDCVTDGEQLKFDGFPSYCLFGNDCVSQEMVDLLQFADGHWRGLPTLKKGPFRYSVTGDQFLKLALEHTDQPVKQAVISPSMLTFMYPRNGIVGYSRTEFIDDLVNEHRAEIRRCLELGAYKVQIDFTEARASLKIDPSGQLLRDMVDLINRALAPFNAEERQRIGIHTCPGSDLDCTHSAEIDYVDLLPTLFEVEVGNFYVAMAGEADPAHGLRVVKSLLRPDIRVFIGVIDPSSPTVESVELVTERILQAARYIPVDQLGICDDCGFSPFADDRSTPRELALAKMKARIAGVRRAEQILHD